MTGPGAPPDDGPLLRDAAPDDLGAVHAIYAEHVRYGLASFELEPPDRETMTARYEEVTARGLPYLVADLDGEVRGFAQAAPYRPRPAYASRWRTRSTSPPASSAAASAGCCSAR